MKELWESTLSTFFSKFVFALMFIIPIFLLEHRTAIITSVALGLSILGFTSFYLTKDTGESWKVVLEHLTIALAVVIITHYVGDWISITFK
jgi:VIT1/CCC1 family predicted Fe2+/Mn2+ transporter